MLRTNSFVIIATLFQCTLLAENSHTTTEQELRYRISQIEPEMQLEAIRPTSAKGLWEVVSSDGRTFHITQDAGHIVVGDLYHIADDGLINLTEATRAVRMREILGSVDEDEMITFPTPSDPVASIMVFTDVGCQFCREFHSRIHEYHRLGIDIRYMAFPRGNMNSDSYYSMVTAWCSKDRGDAIDMLMNGYKLPALSCRNPVSRHMELGRRLRILVTPTIVLEDGRAIPGAISASEIASLLHLDE